MSDSTLTVKVNGADLTEDLLAAGARIEVEEVLDMADAASIAVGVEADAAGEWASAIDDLAFPDAELGITIANDGREYSFSGLVADATWSLAVDRPSELVVRGVDRTSEMDRIEQVVSWPGASDSTVAATIFGAYGFATEVAETPDSPDPDTVIPIQRGTDLAYLRSLASKWGYTAYVEVDGPRTVGHFHPIDPVATASETLALGFGGDASQVQISVELDGGGRVRADRIQPLTDAVTSAEIDGSDQLQGPESLAAPRLRLLGPADVDGEIDPSRAATALARELSFGVRLTAAIDSMNGGPLLRARRTVEVGGIGSRLSGLYLISRVRHVVTPQVHTQQITLVRNAVGAPGLSTSVGGLL